MIVTNNTAIGEILDADRSTAPYFLEMGMHCLGCPHSQSETIEQACGVHGTDADALIGRLNHHFSNR